MGDDLIEIEGEIQIIPVSYQAACVDFRFKGKTESSENGWGVLEVDRENGKITWTVIYFSNADYELEAGMKIDFIANCPVCGKRLAGKLTVDRTYSTLGFEVDEMDDSCDWHIEQALREEQKGESGSGE